MRTVSARVGRFMARGPQNELERRVMEQSEQWLTDCLFAMNIMAKDAPNPADHDLMVGICKALQDRRDAIAMGLSRNN